VRLTPAGARLVDRMAAGDPVPAGDGAQRLARRLLAGGLVHPRPSAAVHGPADVTVVIPVRDRPEGLAATLAALAAPAVPGAAVGAVVVVDDGSRRWAAGATAEVAAAAGARRLRHERAGGPGAARETGWRAATTPLVAFLDADCTPAPGWLDRLLLHLADPAVAAAAPRVVAAVGAGAVARYEAGRSPLDLGPREAAVVPGTRVAYVPTAALLARRAALADVGGFDAALRVGEDVDLVWRLHAGGWTVRYEPASVVAHPARRSPAGLARQRARYGASAAALDRRHPGAAPPVAVSGWSAAAWGLAALGFPAAGVAVAAASTAVAVRRRPAPLRRRDVVRLVGGGHAGAGLPLATAVVRAWWPLALATARWVPGLRPALAAATLVPPLLGWRRHCPDLGPVRWTALHLLDDVAYGAGLWAGALRARRPGPLVPAVGRRRPPRQRAGAASPTTK
jgi:mycofactocin system glycosyltransferase